MNPVHAPIIILWPLLANIPVNVKWQLVTAATEATKQ
jgi:hypothetical protein